MAATKDDIKRWFRRGVEEGKDYMIVVCDTFDWDDYPVYCDLSDYAEKYGSHNNKNMQKIMEIYDLTQDEDEQMAEHRCYRGPTDEMLKSAQDMGFYDE